MSPRHGETLCTSAIHAAVPPARPKEGSKTAPGAPTARGYRSRRRRTSSLPEHVRVPCRPFFPPHCSWGANSPPPPSLQQHSRSWEGNPDLATGQVLHQQTHPWGNPKGLFSGLRTLVFPQSRGRRGEARLWLSHPSGTWLWKWPQKLSRLRARPRASVPPVGQPRYPTPAGKKKRSCAFAELQPPA